MEEKPIYVKSEILPEGIAFKVACAARMANKTKLGTMSNIVILNYKFSAKLQFYNDVEFQKWNDKTINEFDDALKSETWYLVSYGVIGTNVVCKLLNEDKVKDYNFDIFDHKIHKLVMGAEQGGSAKRQRSK